MPFPTFTEVPDYGLKVARTPRVLTAQFGDGYRQDTRDGINVNARVITAQFTRDPADATVLEDWLADMEGAQRFLWQPPGFAAPMVFITTGEIVNTMNNWGQSVVSATFQQVFDPNPA